MPAADNSRQRGWGVVLFSASVVTALILVAEVAVLRVFVVPQFAGMFADFGAGDELPALTLAVTQGHVPYVAALGLAFGLVFVALAGWRTGRHSLSVASLVAGLIAMLAFPVLIITAVYLPIFEVAGNVK